MESMKCVYILILLLLLPTGVPCGDQKSRATSYHNDTTFGLESWTYQMERTTMMTNLHVIYTGTLGEKQYDRIKFACGQILQPIVIIIGIFGNVLSLAVFSDSRSKMRYATKMYMKALCGTDFIYLALSL